MNSMTKVHRMTIAAVLCAIGIIIPLFSPVKILLEPASFTLASHVAIFIAMFISPGTAVFVSLGTMAGFFLAGFPVVVVLRAATHVIFALVGALVLKRNPQILKSVSKSILFALMIACVHAAAEMAVVLPFYFGNEMTAAYYAKGFFTSVVLLVGVGTVVHSTVDFWISWVIWKPLSKLKSLQAQR